MTTWINVVLRSEDSEMVCWVDRHPRLKVGAVITLKAIPDVKWTVSHIYNMTTVSSPRRTWHVGGL